MGDSVVENSPSLKIESLDLFQFRNYQSLHLDGFGKLSIFVGKNAVGKTSIIEAIQLMTDLKSFRTSHADQFVTWNKQNARVAATITDGKRLLEEKLVIEGNKKTYYLNDKEKSARSLKGLIPAVVFSPDDLDLVKGSHSKRRDSIDNLGIALSKNFYTVRSDYLKLLKQKNQALKDEMPASVIESINEVLAKVGVQYIIHRLHILDSHIPYFSWFYQVITDKEEEASIDYILSWDEEPQEIDYSKKEEKDRLFELMMAYLQERLPEEKARKRSIVGPHADKINFLIRPVGDQNSYRNASEYASQGQQRSITLAFKIAELRTIQDILHQQPVLLLDDVMSELDEKRRLMFMKLIGEETQTFITTTNLSYFSQESMEEATIYKLPFEESA